MPRGRFGVVILLPEPLATEVDGIRRAIGDADLDRIPPHLTLVPPVNLSEAARSTGLDVLRAAAAETEPFALHLGPATTFHPVTPTIYLEVRGELAELHDLYRRVFRPPFERELTHSFVPHVTLDADHEPGRVATTVAALEHYQVVLEVDRLVLLRQHDDRVWRPDEEVVFPGASPAREAARR